MALNYRYTGLNTAGGRVVRNASENPVWKNTLIYYTALVLNILLGWVLAKINTHYLTVELYGQYSFFLIFLFMSRSFFGFGLYESVSRQLALAGEEHRRRQLTGIALAWSLVFSLVFGITLLILSSFVDRIFEVQIGELLHIYAWFSGIILIHTFLLLALRGYGRIGLMAESTVYPRIFYLVWLLPVILWQSFTIQQTLTAMFAGYAVTVIITIVRMRPVFTDIRVLSRGILAEIRSYGIHLYVGAIWHELLFHTDKLVISFYLDDRSIAYYTLAYMLTFPLSHFSTSLATSLFRKFSQTHIIDRRVLMANFTFVCCSVMIFILFRYQLILGLFSDAYLPSVALITPLAMAFGFSGLSKPFTLFLMARGKGKVIRNISVIVPVIQIILTVSMVPVYGIFGAAWCTFSVYLLDMLLNLIAYRLLRRTGGA
jgi:O-antigen/teichoic acid export membrane protein